MLTSQLPAFCTNLVLNLLKARDADQSSSRILSKHILLVNSLKTRGLDPADQSSNSIVSKLVVLVNSLHTMLTCLEAAIRATYYKTKQIPHKAELKFLLLLCMICVGGTVARIIFIAD